MVSSKAMETQTIKVTTTASQNKIKEYKNGKEPVGEKGEITEKRARQEKVKTRIEECTTYIHEFVKEDILSILFVS